MGRTVICEEHLLEVLENINDGNVIVPGLIIGQFAGQRDYVVHLPKTRILLPDDGENSEQATVGTFTTLMDINEDILSEHARTVTRMLPGGMWILGYFIISPRDIFSEKNTITKLKTMAQAIHNCTKGNVFMSGKDPSNQMLIFNFCSLSKKYMCKTLDMSSLNSSFRPADWKFKDGITTWLQVDCRFNLDWLTPFVVSSNNLSTKKKFQEVLSQFQEHLDSLIFSINKDFCTMEKTLISIKDYIKDERQSSWKNEEENTHFELMLYDFKEPSIRRKDESGGGKKKTNNLIPEDRLVKLCGILGSRVFLNGKSTAEDAFKAVKEDLMRSLAARLEMHWQTFEEPQDSGKRFLVRYPPRRVLFTPENFEISFSEYVFEGETERDALATLCENLSFDDGKIALLEEVWQVPILPDEDETDGGLVLEKSKEKTKKGSKKQVSIEISGSNKTMTYGIFAAVLCFVLSLVVRFYYT